MAKVIRSYISPKGGGSLVQQVPVSISRAIIASEKVRKKRDGRGGDERNSRERMTRDLQ